MLSGIDMVAKLHEKHAKSMDVCFKSFVCHALKYVTIIVIFQMNEWLFSEKKLVPFLRIILKTGQIVENDYQPWSYTKQTGKLSFVFINRIYVE